LPPPPMHIRLFDAAIRILKVIGGFAFQRADGILIFSSFYPISILEKGLMCVIGRVLRRRVVIFFRSEVLRMRVRSFRGVTRLVLAATDLVLCQTDAARRTFNSEFGVTE